MKQLPEFPERYWEKFDEEPVEIKAYDPESKAVAEAYVQKLERLLEDQEIVDIYHRGSSAWEVVGKGDVEIGVIPGDDRWFETVVKLANHYGEIGNVDEDYARFNDKSEGFGIEVILMRGYTAKLDKKLQGYMTSHPKLLKEYVRVKKKYRYSKREYQRQKDRFFRRVIDTIPN